MSRQQRSHRRRTAPPRHHPPADLWAPTAPLPDVEPIAVPEEVGAMLRSLGDPPPFGGNAVANQYVAGVIERAAAIAAALALSADLLADHGADRSS